MFGRLSFLDTEISGPILVTMGVRKNWCVIRTDKEVLPEETLEFPG